FFYRQRCAAIDDTVTVMAAHGIKTRMEIIGYAFRAQHGHCMGAQMVIHCITNSVSGLLSGKIEMHHLPQRMNAGISTPARRYLYGLTAESGDRLFKILLHGGAILLPLPPCQPGSVIFYRAC